MQLYLRNATPGEWVDLSVSVPSAPTCIVAYDTIDVDTPVATTEVFATPTAPYEWFYEPLPTGERVHVRLEHGADQHSAFLYFGPVGPGVGPGGIDVTCP